MSLARRPPAAAAASPPLTRACLFLAYSAIRSGGPRERAPRLAGAHRAALARPSAAQTPSQVPSGRFVARDLPPCGARRKPEAAARVALARHSTSLCRATSRGALHALAAFARRPAPPPGAPHAPAWRAIGETAACSRGPLAASYTSMPRLGMLRVHSGRPLERAPRLARAHRAALACPSATRIPSPVPSGRFIACDLPPYAARDANQRQLLESIERDPLLRRAERHPGAPYMRWPPSPGALLLRHSSGRPLESAPRTLLGLTGPLYCSAPLEPRATRSASPEQ